MPTFHEVEAAPTNTGGQRKAKKQQPPVRSMLNPDEVWEDPRVQHLLVPVRHRLNPQRKGGPNRKNVSGQVPPPHFIILTPDEARSEEMIRRKVLEKVTSFSTYSDFATEEADSAENTDPELVNASSDIDSAGDGKVVAESLDGEEDIVDVTMNDAGDAHKHSSPAEPPKQ